MADEAITTRSVTTDRIDASELWAGPTQYVIDGDDVIETDAFRIDLSEGTFKSYTLSAEDKIDWTDDSEGYELPEGFEFVGVAGVKEYDGDAEEWSDPDSLTCIYANDDGTKWATVPLAEAK